jgi:hypothetical protein
MLKKLSVFTVSALCVCVIPMQVIAQNSEVAALETEAAQPPIDPAKLKLGQKIAEKLIPPGAYKIMMKNMADKMTTQFVEKALGVNASTYTSSDSNTVEGKTLLELASEKDPNIKERMDITMKVMFTEIGTLMNEMEPVVRKAMAENYARKYSEKQLTDMNIFFDTPSGNAFAANFMSTFTDPEMVDAALAMAPKMLEAMPSIMKKVEVATAHLPPIKDAAGDELFQDNSDLAGAHPDETGKEPWHSPENWTAAELKKVEALSAASNAASEKSAAAHEKYYEAYESAIEAARIKLKPEYDALIKDGKPMAAEDISPNAPPPPIIPKT